MHSSQGGGQKQHKWLLGPMRKNNWTWLWRISSWPTTGIYLLDTFSTSRSELLLEPKLKMSSITMWLSKISWTNKSLLLQHLLINSTLLHELPSHNGFFKNFFLLQTLFVHYLFPFFLYLNFISFSMHFCYSCFVWCKKNKNKNKKNHKKNSKTQKIKKKF